MTKSSVYQHRFGKRARMKKGVQMLEHSSHNEGVAMRVAKSVKRSVSASIIRLDLSP